MGWFLWGVAFGWAVCAVFWYSLRDESKVSDGAWVVFIALAIIAAIVSISLGIASGAIPHGDPTPTSLGR